MDDCHVMYMTFCDTFSDNIHKEYFSNFVPNIKFYDIIISECMFN